MKKITICLLAALISTSFLIGGCGHHSAPEDSSASVSVREEQACQFTDALGREVTVSSIDRVGIASGSFAECWLLAGGTPAAVTEDAITERDLDLPETVADLGSVMRPSAEAILAADLDLLFLSAGMKNHLALADTLDKTELTYAYLDVETFEDYLEVLKIFTDLTGRDDLYQENGIAIADKIDEIISDSYQSDSPKVLILRSSSSKVTARNSETMVGQMLKNLGCTNIADSENSLLEELSLEIIAQEDPDYIFVVCHGDREEAEANLDATIDANPIWQKLDAVTKGNLYYLEKELFHYKPNVRWSESYEVLANIFAEN